MKASQTFGKHEFHNSHQKSPLYFELGAQHASLSSLRPESFSGRMYGTPESQAGQCDPGLVDGGGKVDDEVDGRVAKVQRSGRAVDGFEMLAAEPAHGRRQSREARVVDDLRPHGREHEGAQVRGHAVLVVVHDQAGRGGHPGHRLRWPSHGGG
ncbi:hypothetical protein PspLS_11054 [Pyricularia sp. CBS 133598]|nr:hypothetical protein PspLS_11054 [Pyricularia sp. CBS 133598]